MEKLLSICIPTFNRAQMLDRQLAWLLQEVNELGADCEILVSDNCSEDETPAVIKKWQSVSPVVFRTNRHPENLGWMRNFAYCLNAATGRYTWILGDDDKVDDGTVALVVSTLKTRPDLSLFYLNFCERNLTTGYFSSEPWLKRVEDDVNLPDSKAVFQKHIQENIGSVIFISATIFRTQFGREAYQSWPESLQNWGGLAYWNGYCATKGNVLVTEKTFVECTTGVSYWQKDPKAWFKIRYFDIPEIYSKLYQIGYPRQFCQKMMLHMAEEDFISRNVLNNLKYYLWCFWKAPRWSSRVVAAYISFLLSCTLGRNAAIKLAEVRMPGFSSTAKELVDSQ
ncbi:MAG: glycosyltransferase family 2 protein [Elainella sp. C42_A2020_010]|nr:glycosyltransferase family 2 protein [Elainella sp. C42_A2020_010]RNJ70147.1 MAG: glycosyltransferase family 2 protein [Leptolyngbya sp. IPPAS B-1204]